MLQKLYCAENGHYFPINMFRTIYNVTMYNVTIYTIAIWCCRHLDAIYTALGFKRSSDLKHTGGSVC